MGDRATSQSDNIVPPRRGEILAQAVDSTARAYNLALLPIGGKAIVNSKQTDHIYVTIEADGADIYFQFASSSTPANLDNTASNAAGTAWTATTMSANTSYAAKIASGTIRDFRIERSKDQWLIVKTASGTGTLRLYASSQPEV